METPVIIPKQLSVQSDEDDDGKTLVSSPPQNSKLSVEQGEPRYITIPEAIGLDFNSFIPQADIISQVHFVSNIQPDSEASLAGLKDGDRILQVNGVNVTSLEHEDVRKLMQLMTPITFTVASDPKYLLLLQQPVDDIDEKLPEPLITPVEENGGYDPNNRRQSRYELRRHSSIGSSISTMSSASSSTKLRRCEKFSIIRFDGTSNEEAMAAKLCRLYKSKFYDGYGLVLRYRQHLHIIGEVEEASPSYRAGLRENDVILFVGKTNVEKMTHDDIKIMIRAMALTSDHVELIVISKSDIPRYRSLQEKGLVDWSVMGLENSTSTTSTSTTTTAVPPNLLTNPGAKSGLVGWTQIGPATGIQDTGGTFNSGMFVGGKGSGGSSAGFTQAITLLGGPQNFVAAQLDAGTLKVKIKFYYSYWLSTDDAQVIVTFRSATSVVLGTVNSGAKQCGTNPGWCLYSTTQSLPSGTRFMEYTIKFLRNGGTDIDSYIDDNLLRVM